MSNVIPFKAKHNLISRESIERRVSRLQSNWSVLPSQTLELLDGVLDALKRDALEEAYCLVVLAESYLFV